MKFLLFLVIVLLGVWLWRSGRRGNNPSQAETSEPPPTAGPQDMVPCARCGMHLPHNEAVVGRIGLYCSNEHQQQAEP